MYKNKKEPAGMSGKKKAAIGLVVLFLMLGTVWAFTIGGTDPQVEKVKQMQAEAFKEGLSPEQRRQNFDLIRQEMDKLSPEQRHQVHEQGRANFERRADERIKAYFALSTKEQRTAYLDKQIKEMEDRRKQWEARRAQGQGPDQGRGGGVAAAGGPGGPGGPGGGPGGQPGASGDRGNRGGGSMNADERRQRQNQRLDRSTAQQRSLRSSYMADMRQRRMQLGLPATPQRPQRPPR